MVRGRSDDDRETVFWPHKCGCTHELVVVEKASTRPAAQAQARQNPGMEKSPMPHLRSYWQLTVSGRERLSCL